MEPKRLYRSDSDRMLLGVCGGIGEYLNVDSTIIRLLWAILVFWGGIGILAYLVAAVIIPGQPDYR
ncbi:MAG TPA: PspC domain-containing protein [Candidatus Copromonas avistercoris]|nr:PspC domain-containing protein [Candidatus Copromonas avistercoris]